MIPVDESAHKLSLRDNNHEEEDDPADIQFLHVGRERFIADRRQIGGLVLILGLCVTFQPLGNIVPLVGADNASGTAIGRSALETATLVGAVLQFLFGTSSMVVGYLSLVHDYGYYVLTGMLIFFTQLAWIPFITGMVEIGQAASPPFTVDTRRSVTNGTVFLEEYVVNPFIPPEYLPNERDVKFFGAMGILGVMAYGIGFFGSLGFMQFALYSFDVGKPTHRDARFFRGRLVFYSFVLALAGVSQLLLGSHILFEFGGGPLSPSVGVAVYQVYFPEITVAMGCVQLCVGYVGIARYLNYLPVGPDDHEMQGVAFLGWFLQLLLQFVVQISYGTVDDNTAILPSLALLSFGMNLLPAYLDYKMRIMPHCLTNDYYGIIAGNAKGLEGDTESKLIVLCCGGGEDSVKENGSISVNLGAGTVADEQDKPSGLDKKLSDWTLAPSDGDKEEKPSIQPPSQTNSVASGAEGDGLEADEDEAIESRPTSLNDDEVAHDVESGEISLGFEQETRVTETDQRMDDKCGVEEDEEAKGVRSMKRIDLVANDDEEEGVVFVEEFVEYPDFFQPNSNDRDDRTPPQSNKSFEIDMEDSWGKTLTPPQRLPPLDEEDTERMLAEEDDDDFHAVAVTPEESIETKDFTPASARSLMSEFSADYSTPSDDSVALETKINRLQRDLLVDTNMESYLKNFL